MKILFLTDLHAAQDYVAPLLDAEPDADLILVGGDTTNFGGADVARSMLAPLRERAPVLGVPGNVDRPDVLTWLAEEGLSVHGEGREVAGLWVSGCGGSNVTPFNTILELDEPALAQLLRDGAPPPDSSLPWVLVSHTPPLDTACDRLFTGGHVGSPAVREFLTQHQPALCLCGHIHESVATDRLGRTEVVNPGSFATGRYAVVEREGDAFEVELCRLGLSLGKKLRAEASGLAAKAVGYARHRLKRGD